MLTADCPLPADAERVFAWSEQSPRYALAAAQRLLAAERSGPTQLAYGWALLSAERFAAARPWFETALPLLAQPSHRLLCRFGLLVLELQTLAKSDLDEDFAALARDCATAEAFHLCAWVQLEQARLLNVLGRPLEAEALLGVIAPALERQGPLGAGRWRRALAVSAYWQSDYAQAQALLAEAEALFQPRRYLLDRARCWFEQAVVALNQGQLATAYQLYGRAGRVAQAAELPLRQAYCLRGSGLAALRQGQYDLALRETLDAAELFGGLGRPYDVAVCAVHRGNIHLHTGRLQAALAAYTRAEELFSAAGYLVDRTMVRRNSALVLRAQGRSDEAASLLAAVEQEATTLNLRGEVGEAISAQAAVLADQGQLDAAEARFTTARELFETLLNPAAAAECRLEQGWLALRKGDLSAAQNLLELAATALANRPHHLWRAHYGLGQCAEQHAKPGAALAFYLAACTSVAGLRRRLASEAASSGLFSQASALFADALRLAAAQGDAHALLAVIEGQRALTLGRLLMAPASTDRGPLLEALEAARPQLDALSVGGRLAGAALDQALEAYDAQILNARHASTALPALEAIAADQPFDLALVRQSLNAAFGADWTVLIYGFSGEQLHQLVLSADGLEVASCPDNADLRKLIAQVSLPAYRHYTYADVPLLQGLTERPWERIEAVSAQLLPASLLDRLHPRHRLLVVPAGPLHALPWAALRLNGRWLAEQAIIHVLPSLSVAPLLSGRTSPNGLPGSALLVGCRTFGGRAKALPGVAHELATIRASWPGPLRQLRDAAATRTALAAALVEAPTAYALLHLASHARLLPAHGLMAHVKLWDDDLLLPEVVGLGLAGAVVVLSACDGAAAEVLPGEEVLSLSWAFLAGGASGVLASLWPIGDAPTVVLMQAIYAGLAVGLDPALALALAQRHLLVSSGADAVPPQLWGSFTAVGGLTAH